MATRVHESAIIDAPIAKVWGCVRAMDFTWWKLVEKTAVTQGASAAEVGSSHKMTFKDGSSWTVRLSELSDADHFITYELVSSEEPLPVSSAIHTIRLRRITSSSQTFIEWVSDYSSDATQAVIQDSRFKKLEGFKDLQAVCKA